MDKTSERHLRGDGVPPAKSGTGNSSPHRQKQKKIKNSSSLSSENGWTSSSFRFLGRFLIILAPLILFSFIAGVVVYLRLLHAPVSLKLLTQSIEEGITSQFTELTAKIDTALLQHDEKGGFAFQLINLRLLNKQGTQVASAPVAEVSLDLSQIIFLKVVPRRVDFINPRISLFYTRDEGLALSFASSNDDKISNDAISNVAELIKNNSIEFDTSASQVAKLNLARVLTDFTARARRDENASSGITQIGFRNSLVDFIYEGAKSQLKIADLNIDLNHHLRSSRIAASAQIESKFGPWSLVVTTEDSDQTGVLTLKAAIKDLKPKTLSNVLPSSRLLDVFDFPLEGQAKIELKTSGELKRADFLINVGHGEINFGPALSNPFLLDSGNFSFSYDTTSDIIRLNPSTLKWAGSYLTFSGEIKSERNLGAAPIWSYVIQSKEGMIGGDDFGIKPAPIEVFKAVGQILPEVNTLQISNAVLRAFGSQFSVVGDFITGDPQTAGVKIEGRLTNGNNAFLKAFWPRMVAPRAREWSRSHLRTAQTLNGHLQFLSGIFSPVHPVSKKADVNESILLDLKAERVEFLPWNKAQQIFAPQVFIKMENYDIDIGVPEAFLLSDSTKDLILRDGRFLAKEIDNSQSRGTVNFKIQSNLSQTFEALKLMRFSGFEKLKLPSDMMDGKFDGGFIINLPLTPDVEAESFLIDGKAKITDLKTKDKSTSFNLQSGSIDLVLDEKEVKAKGDIYLNGVLAKVDWQQSLREGEKSTTPFEFSTLLDYEARNKLGLDINDYVQGDIPVIVRFADKNLNDPKSSQIQVLVDLSKCELALPDLAWKKLRGRPAKLQFDVVNLKNNKTELQNFKLTGEQIAVEGWVGLSTDRKPQEFNFQTFSLNLVSRLQVQGKRSSSDIWDVKARGTTFDGKDFFRSLFSFNTSSESSPLSTQKTGGLDLDVEIDNVLGHSNVSLHGFRCRSSRRGDKLTKLEASGTLDGGDSLTVKLVYLQGGFRKIYADTQDSGQALRLVGFYPNMQNGRVHLEVDLDGKGPAEKSGILWIENFRVLGDPVVSEVFSGINGDGPAIGAVASGEQRLVREVFEFDRLRMPFSVGYGQFVIEETYLKGPIVGATLRGKLDYTMQRINVGGTYIPLQGLNNALGGIPILGQIFSGPRKEGIFGITFALQGPMTRPQVIVNPFSLVAPGIFREMFQMTSPNTRVLPREQLPQQFMSQPRTLQPPTKGQKSKVPPTKLNGWSSETLVPMRTN